ncbi:MAG TPA: M3 family metallopeptidase [Acidobacteriota bacterium]|nr:M3 family metallopeptidase [Acidobacteriota bacterium]
MKWLWLVLVFGFIVTSGMVQAQDSSTQDNPFFSEWTTPFQVPPFEKIKTEHFLPALREGIAQQRREVEAIIKNQEPPSFANTIEALDACGEFLDRVQGVFSNLRSAETNDQLEEIARTISPELTALHDDILLNEQLFSKVESLWKKRAELQLSSDQRKLLEETYKDFVRGGAKLAPEQKKRLRAINEEMALLSLKFGQNLLKETNGFRLVIEDEKDLAGLPAPVIAAGAEAAKAAGLPGKWVYTLHAPSIWPFVSYAENRDLRCRMVTAYMMRGDNGNEYDNKAIVSRLAALRAERAKLLGYLTHAHFVLEERMAKTPDQVYDLLNQLWGPALKVAKQEAAEIQAMIEAEGHDFKLEPWDWHYYAEKIKKAKYDLDENQVREYFTLDNVRQGAFYVANRLYGLTFEERTDIPKYHPEVKTFEVKDADGRHLGVFLADYHPRPGKRVGAWSSRYRGQRIKNGKDIRPIVVNVCNFTRPAGQQPALLRLEEVQTLFHEFGHALHSLLSQIRYQSLAGVPRDFVELPSQIMENWALEPEVLKVYAKHYKTGEVIPSELVARINNAKKFNQGFATVEYLAASFLDMDWHVLSEPREVEARVFEKAALSKIQMMPEIIVRYRSPYFQHIFSGGYSAGYYSYIWSEVLDSDAFEAFKEKGLFDSATAKSFRTNILERGGTMDAMEMYKSFRGREPSVEPLLKKRGLN